MRIRLMTFNLAHGRGLGLYQGFTREAKLRANISAIARLMRELRVDLAALQEIDEDSHWHRGVRMMDLLSEEAGFAHNMMGVNNRRAGDKPLAYGNALLSKLPVELWDNQPFGDASLGEKGFMYAELALGGPYLLPLINLHLDYRSRIRRIGQVERLIDYMAARPARPDRVHLPPIVCGDFNSRAERAGDAVMHLFRHLVEQNGCCLYPENARTFPSFFPSRGIDFAFVPSGFRVSECHVIPALLSDHRPVLVEFEIASL
jgi:endonuclease/exonuclease/phosphatase family metal-dependent hydrolase